MKLFCIPPSPRMIITNSYGQKTNTIYSDTTSGGYAIVLNLLSDTIFTLSHYRTNIGNHWGCGNSFMSDYFMIGKILYKANQIILRGKTNLIKRNSKEVLKFIKNDKVKVKLTYVEFDTK